MNLATELSFQKYKHELENPSVRMQRFAKRLEEEEELNVLKTIALIVTLAVAFFTFFSSQASLQLAVLAFITYSPLRRYLSSDYVILSEKLKHLRDREQSFVDFGNTLSDRIKAEEVSLIVYINEAAKNIMLETIDTQKNLPEFLQDLRERICPKNTLPKSTCCIIAKSFLYIQYLKSLNEQTTPFETLYEDIYLGTTRHQRDIDTRAFSYNGKTYTVSEISM